MQRRSKLLSASRSLHIYLGVFTTPAILFFALTGALQTFHLHEAGRGASSYRPLYWIAAAAQWHKKQSPMLPPPRRPEPARAASRRPPKPAPTKTEHLPMKVFFVLVSFSLFASTATGLVLAYRYHRNKPAMAAALAAGVVVPVLLLFF